MPRKSQPKQQPGWATRIIGYADVPTALLAPNPLNPRLHDEMQSEALSEILRSIGIVQNVVVNATTSDLELLDDADTADDAVTIYRSDRDIPTIEHVRLSSPHLIDGHLRLALAKEYHQPSLPVTFVALTEEEEAKVLATFDPLGSMARYDAERLESLYENFDFQNEQLQLLMADLADAAGLRSLPAFTPDEPSQPTEAPPAQPVQPRKQITLALASQDFALLTDAVKKLGKHYDLTALPEIVLQTLLDAAATIPSPHVLPRRKRPEKAADGQLGTNTPETPQNPSLAQPRPIPAAPLAKAAATSHVDTVDLPLLIVPPARSNTPVTAPDIFAEEPEEEFS